MKAIVRAIWRVLMLPIYALQLGTSAKSFLDNPLIGSQRLNRMGLHRARMRLAARMTAWRRRRLASVVSARHREAFDRDGFVVIEGFVPDDEFRELRRSILNYEADAREMMQGDAITRRLAIDAAMLKAIPSLRRHLARSDINALFHYVSSFRIKPIHYVQTIVSKSGGEPDPQETLHADAFHSSMKAWLFLNDVAEDQSPFTFVPGSHKLQEGRLAWEYCRSIAKPTSMDRLSARGSPRVNAPELTEMGLPPARKLAVRANTLVVADTLGFHARGPAIQSGERVEIWSYARRNPFLPWLGGDPFSLPGIAERRARAAWKARDLAPSLLGQPWRKAGFRKPVE